MHFFAEHLQRKNAQANETSPNAHSSSTASITPQQISQALSQAGQAMSGTKGIEISKPVV